MKNNQIIEKKSLEIPTLSINNESLLCCDSCDSTCLPPVLQIAWPVPNYCHSSTDCSVTASCTACINTHSHTHTSSVICRSPCPGVLTLPLVFVTEGWVTTHTYQMCSFPLKPSLWLSLPSKLNGRTGDKAAETSTCWRDILNTFAGQGTHRRGSEAGGCCWSFNSW